MGRAWGSEKAEATKYSRECLRPCSDALRHVLEHNIKLIAADRQLKHAPKTSLEHWQLRASTGFHLRSLSPSLATHMRKRSGNSPQSFFNLQFLFIEATTDAARIPHCSIVSCQGRTTGFALRMPFRNNATAVSWRSKSGMSGACALASCP